MITDWQSKVWGKTRCLEDYSFYSKHELEIISGGYCSFHFHKERSNIFHVVSGAIRIVWSYGWKIESTVLTSNCCCKMHSLIPHQFQVLESGKIYEIYIPDRGGEVRNEDIIRLTHGSKIDVERFIDTVGILKEDGTFWEV